MKRARPRRNRPPSPPSASRTSSFAEYEPPPYPHAAAGYAVPAEDDEEEGYEPPTWPDYSYGYVEPSDALLDNYSPAYTDRPGYPDGDFAPAPLYPGPSPSEKGEMAPVWPEWQDDLIGQYGKHGQSSEPPGTEVDTESPPEDYHAANECGARIAQLEQDLADARRRLEEAELEAGLWREKYEQAAAGGERYRAEGREQAASEARQRAEQGLELVGKIRDSGKEAIRELLAGIRTLGSLQDFLEDLTREPPRELEGDEDTGDVNEGNL
ncbi:hypothetical protein DFJ74DRAFT_674215 [Hyaloraphidium curvatum]|nr:hypothetical protein DFJ74DRAFT_674215 [Hyaloraphidium curvatum]